MLCTCRPMISRCCVGSSVTEYCISMPRRTILSLSLHPKLMCFLGGRQEGEPGSSKLGLMSTNRGAARGSRLSMLHSCALSTTIGFSATTTARSQPESPCCESEGNSSAATISGTAEVLPHSEFDRCHERHSCDRLVAPSQFFSSVKAGGCVTDDMKKQVARRG